MRSFASSRLRHVAQRAVERARAQEERRLQQRAVDLALEDAGAHEIEEALDQHLAHAVQALIERIAFPQPGRRAVGGIEPRRDGTEVGVGPMPQDQRMRHRVAERADAELQGAAVGDGARDVDAHGVLGELDGFARRGEQRKVGRRPLQQKVEFALGQIAVAGHERQLGIDLPDEQKVALPARARLQQIEREVRVAAQAQARLARARAPGDELRHHVHPAIEHIAQRVGVVGGDVALLRGGDAEAGAGLEEELVDDDVRRQRARTQRLGIGELGIAGEHALRERLHEAPFEARPAAWRLQCQRGEDMEADRRVGRRAREQGVGDVVGLAEAERQRQHDVFADAGDDGVGDAIRMVEPVGAAVVALHVRPMGCGAR